MKKNRFIALALAAGMTFCNVAATGVVAYAIENDNSNVVTNAIENDNSNVVTNAKYKFTIENTSNTAHTFYVYQIFAGTLYEEKNEKNEVVKRTLSDIVWGSGVLTNEKGELVDGNNEVILNNSAEAQAKKLTSENVDDFADVLVKGNSHINGSQSGFDIPDTDSCLNDANKYVTEKPVASGDSYTFENLEAGYYLVIDKDGTQANGAYTKYMLQIVGDTTEKAKADAPSSLKKVDENAKDVTGNTDTRISGYTLNTGKDEGEKYNDVADYSIGEAIPYELVGTLPSRYSDYDTYYYSFVDTMSKGLTLDKNSVSVWHKASKEATTETDITIADNIKVTIDPTSKETTLTVTYDDLKQLKDSNNKPLVTADSVIIVRYKAELNNDAYIGLPGNENTFYLEYSNNPNKGGSGDHGKTPEDKNIVFTYQLDVNKYTNVVEGESTIEQSLAGAKFKLYKDNEKKAGATVKDGVFEGWGTASELTTDENGLVHIKGLDAGTYYLEETVAPNGYNKINKLIQIVITANTNNNQAWDETTEGAFVDKKPELKAITTILLDDETQRTSVDSTGVLNTTSADNGIVTTKILNEAGVVLPSTGGVGTTIMYVLGGILVIGGAAAIFIKRKKDSE